MLYRVTWCIDIDADTAEDAARMAREVQTDLDADWVFDVRAEDKPEPTEVLVPSRWS